MIVTAYDGTDFSGFAAQKDPLVRTVEGELNKALFELTREGIHVIGASRTDAGVHALCNFAVFDTNSPIPPRNFAKALNSHLPQDLRVRQSKEVDPSFHPRAVRTIKTYEYRIYTARVEDPLKSRYYAYTWFNLDIQKMQQGASYLVGEHDFASFCNPSRNYPSTVREILSIEIEETLCPVPDLMLSRSHTVAQQDEAKEIVIRVTGKGFLYNMVRIIAGTLMRVGRGLLQPEDIPLILGKKDRQSAGETANACGLCLVNYRILGASTDGKEIVDD